MRRSQILAIAATIAGCAANHQIQSTAVPARLSFANQVDVKHGFPGSFVSIDGKRLNGFPGKIEVSAGKHEIGYYCPNIISMDYLPTVRATFIQGIDYVLECSINQPGVKGVIKQR